jgi:hypothetical protein
MGFGGIAPGAGQVRQAELALAEGLQGGGQGREGCAHGRKQGKKRFGG